MRSGRCRIAGAVLPAPCGSCAAWLPACAVGYQPPPTTPLCALCRGHASHQLRVCHACGPEARPPHPHPQTATRTGAQARAHGTAPNRRTHPTATRNPRPENANSFLYQGADESGNLMDEWASDSDGSSPWRCHPTSSGSFSGLVMDTSVTDEGAVGPALGGTVTLAVVAEDCLSVVVSMEMATTELDRALDMESPGCMAACGAATPRAATPSGACGCGLVWPAWLADRWLVQCGEVVVVWTVARPGGSSTRWGRMHRCPWCRGAVESGLVWGKGE